MKNKNEYKQINNDEKQCIINNKINNKNILGKKHFIFLVILFLIIALNIKKLYLYYLLAKIKIKHKYNHNIENIIIEKDLNKEMKDMKEFIYLTLNGKLIYNEDIFKKVKKPKISIVIAAYNAEGYIQNALHSIQNQDFKDIEIVIVDDNSKDNTINLVKELMRKDERIKLYQNDENMGTFYTKTKGVLKSKGKYVMILDQDDIYTQSDVFSTLYSYIEKTNLDIIGFSSIFSNNNNNKIGLNATKLVHYFETPVLYQPKVSQRMYEFNENGMPNRINYVIWDYIYKTELFKNVIKQIDDKFMNTKMVCHEDFLLFFLLSRKAKTLKYIKRIFYVNIQWRKETNDKIKYCIEEKYKQINNLQCLSYLNYIEFLLINTENSVQDKRIASFEFNNWYFNNECRRNEFIKDKGKNICKMFINNEYIDNTLKEKIRRFLDEI